jgi:hypothetical protein
MVEALSSVLCLGTFGDGRQPVVQPATVLIPETEGEEGVVWSRHVLFGSYLT